MFHHTSSEFRTFIFSEFWHYTAGTTFFPPVYGSKLARTLWCLCERYSKCHHCPLYKWWLLKRKYQQVYEIVQIYYTRTYTYISIFFVFLKSDYTRECILTALFQISTSPLPQAQYLRFYFWKLFNKSYRFHVTAPNSEKENIYIHPWLSLMSIIRNRRIFSLCGRTSNLFQNLCLRMLPKSQTLFGYSWKSFQKIPLFKF